MTQEEIEKAACEYDDSLIYSPIPEQYDVPKAFIAGVNWRINTVWHNASEMPENKFALVEYDCFPKGHGYVVVPDPREVIRSITRWAYIEDLLPIKD